MTITKNSLVNLLHDEVGLNKREAKEFIETFFEVIKLELENGNDVKISGFGNFNLRDKAARPGRNPKTGEDVTISERRVVTFKSGLKLRSKLEAYDGNIWHYKQIQNAINFMMSANLNSEEMLHKRKIKIKGLK